MPVVRYRGGVPQSIVEGSGPGDWIANLGLSGDLSRLLSVEATGPDAAFFSAAWNPALGVVAVRPGARLDFEAFSAAGALPEVGFGLRFVFDDGTVQEDAPPFRVAVLDRDDTAPTGLSFSANGAVAVGEIGAAIGTLAVADPDSAGPFRFSFSWEDEWRFEVVEGGVLKLRDGIAFGLDDAPSRPLLIEVSDGTQSAAFFLEIAVAGFEAPPPAPPPPPPLLAAGETRAGFALSGPREALTARPAAEAGAVRSHPGGVRQVVSESGEEAWIGPVDRLRFADGWLGRADGGPAAEAAAIHRAVTGEDADGAELAPLAAALRAGAGWAEVADGLLGAAPALASLDDAAFVSALFRASTGAAPGAAELDLHTGRLESGASRAQVAADVALSPAAMARIAEDSPAGHWVADPFDAAAGLPPRPAFEDPAPAPAAPSAGTTWFM